MLIHGINNNIKYCFSNRMGASIGINDPDPISIIRGLSRFSRKVASVLSRDFQAFTPGVQYGNESDLYFDDPLLLDAINKERKAPETVIPIIHQTSGNQPLKGGFIEKMAQISNLCQIFQTRNVCVHLPLEPFDTTAELLEVLTQDGLLDAIADVNIAIDLEQNWHDSWFGFTEHLLEFFPALDDALERKGHEGLQDKFGMTFDSGHFFAQYHLSGASWRDMEKDMENLFSRLGDRIRTIHLHGNDGTGDHHALFRRNHPNTLQGRRFKKNQDILFKHLPMLNLSDRNTRDKWDTVIISEIGNPFNEDAFIEHARLIAANLHEK
ncbi:hypothetical protein GF325_09690 [Candidatus Bathyarchaeota archaeon]|nr:hypothetical protein [Candidatus Bathyarchaeota archaeon]